MATIGIDKDCISFHLYNDLMVRVILFDTAGQERFRSINEIYYNKNDSIILIYDISRKSTFEECKEYYRDKIKEKCKNDIKVILIGNKIDLEDNREVTTEEGYDFALQNGYMFIETSCLTNENIYDALEAIIYETFLIKNETVLIKMKEEENKDNNHKKIKFFKMNKIIKYINF